MQHTFRDKLNRLWRIDLDIETLERVRAATGVNLLFGLTQFGQRIEAEPELFARLAWVLVERQAVALGIEPEDFGRSTHDVKVNEAIGDALGNAIAARASRPLRRKLLAIR